MGGLTKKKKKKTWKTFSRKLQAHSTLNSVMFFHIFAQFVSLSHLNITLNEDEAFPDDAIKNIYSIVLVLPCFTSVCVSFHSTVFF